MTPNKRDETEKNVYDVLFFFSIFLLFILSAYQFRGTEIDVR